MNTLAIVGGAASAARSGWSSASYASTHARARPFGARVFDERGAEAGRQRELLDDLVEGPVEGFGQGGQEAGGERDRRCSHASAGAQNSHIFARMSASESEACESGEAGP